MVTPPRWHDWVLGGLLAVVFITGLLALWGRDLEALWSQDDDAEEVR